MKDTLDTNADLAAARRPPDRTPRAHPIPSMTPRRPALSTTKHHKASTKQPSMGRLRLTRFDGHLTIWEEGVQDAEPENSLST